MLINNFKKIALHTVLATVIIFSYSSVRAESPIVAPPPQQIQAEPFIHDQLSIKIDTDEHLLFNVELALTPRQQAKGMMYRTYMADDSGMLFVFKGEAKRSFWMKNTLIPLDMLFIAADGEIVHIHHNAKPQDLTKITAEEDAMAVLELKGSTADKMGIKKGDYVQHSVFRNIVSK